MKDHRTAIKKLSIGLFISLALTTVSYLIVTQHVNGMHQNLSHTTIFVPLTIFAALQSFVQAIYFLHIKDDPGHYKQVSGVLALTLIFFLIIASIWIMSSLDYNMTPREYEDVVQQEEKIIPQYHGHQ